MRIARGDSAVLGAPTVVAPGVDRTGGTADAGPATIAAGGLGAHLVEIVCDESGSEGEKLVGGSTDVFTHASLNIGVDSALACIDEVRLRARSPAEECKASVVLRERNRPLLEWLLGPRGPIHGHGHVHITDKRLYLVHKLVELLWPQDATAGERSAAVGRVDAAVRARSRGSDPRPRPTVWEALLMAFNDLVRARDLTLARPLRDRFRAALGAVLDAELVAETQAAAALTDVVTSGLRSDADLARLIDKSDAVSVLDPLVPALARSVRHWVTPGRNVFVVHDVQDALTAERIEHLERACGGAALAGVCFVDSQHDPRIQVADFLAGAARKIASDELNGRGDPTLRSLLAPYVDEHSMWSSSRSWWSVRPVAPATRAAAS